jgi:hypothetical protein
MNRESARELMGRNDFLLSAVVVSLNDNPERALFIGRYARQYFQDIATFCEFRSRISAATQDWYTFRNLDLAVANLTDYDRWSSSWLSRATKNQGRLRNLLQQLNVDVGPADVPADISGEFFWIGNSDEFDLVGQCSDCWLDVFLGDRVD